MQNVKKPCIFNVKKIIRFTARQRSDHFKTASKDLTLFIEIYPTPILY